MNLSQCLDILELPPDVGSVTYEDAKAAHRIMVQVWHPDRYGHNEALHARATAKMQEINSAWEQVEHYFMSCNVKGVIARHGASHANWAVAPNRNYSENVCCPSCGVDNFVRDVRGYNPCEACCYELSPRGHDTAMSHELKLVWPYDADIARRAMNRDDATVWLESLKYRNDAGWRLPTIEEFTLIDCNASNPPSSYQKRQYKNLQDGPYWVASDYAAWGVFMIHGDVIGYDPYGCYRVWPVRNLDR
jgi:hypothetical protein